MTAHSTGQAPAAGPDSTPTAVTDRPVADASKRRPRRPGEPTPWQRRTYGFGRYAVLAIPAFALIAGLLPRSSAAFSIDPSVYAHYLATGQWRPREAIATIGLAVTGVLSIVALASLLFRGRARGFAIAGLVAGLAGSAGMLASVGSTVIREDRLRHAFVDLHWSDLAFNADTTGTGSGLLAAGGALLLTLGWILLGVAVIRTSGMNRADGPLLMISTPLIFLGGMVAHVLPTMGSFLLLAAGLGILLTAGRISVIGEDTWQQRRRRSPLAVTGSAATPMSAGVADPGAGVALDLAPGLAGSLGLARPQLYPERPVATSAIYHAPVTSAAEPSESIGSPTVAPSMPEPATAVSGGGQPDPTTHSNAAPANDADRSGTEVATNGAPPSSGPAPSKEAAPSNGPAPSKEAAPSNGIAPSNGADAQGEAAAGSRGGTGSPQNGNSAGGGRTPDGRTPAGKSLRDLLRGARGAAAAWPVYRSRSGAPNSGNARDNRGQPGNRSNENQRDVTNGRSGTNGRSASNGRTGTTGRNGARSVGRGGRGANSTSAAGRSAVTPGSKGRQPDPGTDRGGTTEPPNGRSGTKPAKQPPSRPAIDKPDPSTGSPPARE
ncbi:MAG TPA: hypothetical protein VE132_16810 [Micromonosporaceae bacterium]|nr:hypothetical protein [Micromonosporaceae bacterium]